MFEIRAPRTVALARSAIVVSLITLVAGCSTKVISQDGAELVFRGDTISYDAPNSETTMCRYEKIRQLVICDDGTESEIVTAGLPFVGIVFVEFDGRQFSTDEFMNVEEPPTNNTQ